MASLFSGLRRAAPRLNRELFVCHQCLYKSAPTATRQLVGRSQTLGNIRFSSTGTASPSTPLGTLGRVLREAPTSNNNKIKQPTIQQTTSGFFPQKSSKSVAYWLLASAGSVFGIVVFGGLTRLTESGLVQLADRESTELI